MIARIEGKIIMKGDRFLIIDTNGVGYQVFTPPHVLRESPVKGEQCALWIHTHVREDALELYGFLEYAELDFFKLLISVSGIGPKSALGVLGVAPLDTIKKAIASGESSYLTKVSGIGRKTAEKIIVELRDRLGRLEEFSDSQFKEDEDVLTALESLGYSKIEARDALKKVSNDTTGANARIKEALKIMGK